MRTRAVTTVLRPREELERLWQTSQHRPKAVDEGAATVSFVDAPGDRGTEVHVELTKTPPGGAVGDAVRKLTGSDPLATLKDELRHFKQHVETGVVPRSDGTPEGESLARKLRQRPAQPMDASELQQAGPS